VWQSLLGGEWLPNDLAQGRRDDPLSVGDAEALGHLAARDGNRGETDVSFYELLTDSVGAVVQFFKIPEGYIFNSFRDLGELFSAVYS